MAWKLLVRFDVDTIDVTGMIDLQVGNVEDGIGVDGQVQAHGPLGGRVVEAARPDHVRMVEEQDSVGRRGEASEGRE
ncbi:MAG TPA: hypothetical protein VKM69_09435 [Natronoarchaeum rubrum]|nr:hypothetical protein [Natronoarchaeum rubrum]